MCISNQKALKFILWLKRIYHRYSLNHIILLISYILFILLSATIFFVIESHNSKSFHKKWILQLADDRDRFIREELVPEIFNNTKLLLYIHDQKAQYLTNIINLRLESYEQQLKLRPPMPTMRCTYMHSILFVFSTVTTIGYGYLYPVTSAGRIFSIVCSLIGIPFTIIVIKDLAFLLAKLLDFPFFILEKLWALFRFCTLKPVHENEIERKLQEERNKQLDHRLANQDRLLSIPVTVAIFAVLGWATIGCVIVQAYMPHVDTSTAFYFIFNSLTTTGVGDIEPGENSLLLLIFSFYLLLGLAIVSLFINLIHAKFSKAYWYPDKLYIPLSTGGGLGEKLATFDSFDELLPGDAQLHHLITIGVLQAEDKCQLLNVAGQQSALIENTTQTQESGPIERFVHSSRNSPEPVVIPNIHTSHEDVNSLIVETYGARPAMLMRNMMR